MLKVLMEKVKDEKKGEEKLAPAKKVGIRELQQPVFLQQRANLQLLLLKLSNKLYAQKSKVE